MLQNNLSVPTFLFFLQLPVNWLGHHRFFE